MSKFFRQLGPVACGLWLAAISGCVDTSTDDEGEISSEVKHGFDQLNDDEQLAASNDAGIAATFSTLGPIDFNNAFFRSDISPVGRSCATCHDPSSGWTVSADLAKATFNETGGTDPLFRIHDTGTRPDAPTGTKRERRETYRPMWEHGLIRFEQSIPATAEFEIVSVDDPYGFGTPADSTRFRRPNPMSNEAFVASVTWTAGGLPVPLFLQILFPVAVTFHGAGPTPDPALSVEAANLSLSVFHAQVIDRKAGRLDAEGAHGGPVALASQPFFIGINSGDSFNPKVFDLYDAWEHSDNPHRRQIWRGQQVFNTKTFGNGRTCGGCHNTPNVGSSSTFVTRNVGTDDANEPVDLSYLPKLTIRNKTTGETRVVTDLGVGLDGVWAHVGQYKVQHLRGLASRTPLFHDGRAKTVGDVVNHYERFFNIDFQGSEKDDLVAFLNAL